MTGAVVIGLGAVSLPMLESEVEAWIGTLESATQPEGARL